MAREINPKYRRTKDVEHLCETLKSMGYMATQCQQNCYVIHVIRTEPK